MASSCSKKPRPIIASFVSLLLLASSCSVLASAKNEGNSTKTPFHSKDELLRYRRIMAQMARTKKASVKTIQSPDGDAIDCVPSHLQPAFDHPKLKGQKPEDEPEERPKCGEADAVQEEEAVFPQAWRDTGESCPEGTVPLRRTTESDLLRSSSVRRFGMKPRAGNVRRDSTSDGHEHAVGYVTGDQF